MTCFCNFLQEFSVNIPKQHPRHTHVALWFACALGLVEHPQLLSQIFHLQRWLKGILQYWSCNSKCGRGCRCQFWGSWICSTVDPSDWHDGSPYPQARPPKPAWSCGCSDISHRCVGWGVAIFLLQIPWCRCRRGAMTWLLVEICEMIGFSWYILYIFLRRIVGEEKGIGTNVFRCHQKTIEVLTQKIERGVPHGKHLWQTDIWFAPVIGKALVKGFFYGGILFMGLVDLNRVLIYTKSTKWYSCYKIQYVSNISSSKILHIPYNIYYKLYTISYLWYCILYTIYWWSQ